VKKNLKEDNHGTINKMNKDKFFLLNLKLAAIIIGLWILFVILHNAVYAIFGIEEAVFFIIAVIIIPLYAIMCIIYTAYKIIGRRIKQSKK
jgi:hypothetical protein